LECSGLINSKRRSSGFVALVKDQPMTTIIAMLGVLIAAFGALIAYFQWRTAHQRVVLDLFERRLAVFRDLEEAAKGALVEGGAAKIEPAFWKYVRAEANARFLFGEEVIAALAALRRDFADVMAFSDIADDHPERRQLIDRKCAALQRLAAFAQDASPLFASYIRLDQKMTGLWWPLPSVFRATAKFSHRHRQQC
jgi:hypothetical protein